MRRHPKLPHLSRAGGIIDPHQLQRAGGGVIDDDKGQLFSIGHRHRLAQQQRPAAAGIDEADGAEPFCKNNNM